MGERKSDEKWYYSFLPNNMAGGSTSPLIPLFVTEGLGGTVGQVGLVSAVSSLASVPSYILWGNLSDMAKKRRIFILIGFGGMALALLLMGLSTSFASYLVANFVLGLLSTAAAPVGTVLILEAFKKEEWAKRLGDFSKVGGIGWVTGLMLGTVWLAFFTGSADPVLPMRALFILAAGLAAVSMLLAWLWVPEPKTTIDRREIGIYLIKVPLIVFERARYLPQRVLHVMKLSTTNLQMKNFPANLKRYYMVTFIIFTGFLCFYVGFPIFLKSYLGMSSSDVFIVYVASSLVSAFTYAKAGKWATSIGSKRLQLLTLSGRALLFPAFFLVTMLGLPYFGLLIAMCILHGLLGFCWANISVAGNHIVSNICNPEFRAESSGIYNAMQGAANIAGALIGGFIAQIYGYEIVFFVASVILVAGIALLFFTNVEKAPAEEQVKVQEGKRSAAN